MTPLASIQLNVDGAYFPSGIPVEVDDDIAENAISLGLAALTIDEAEAATIEPPEETQADDAIEVETATVEPPETATATRAKRKR
jgi:hypothetical protein